ncbi:MAG TPA: heme ABC transporter permease [Devosiaceae bacterium]|jgi:heme exporter protein C|nr:heme ABC transporter permease [Devosiaceae bacterium]
MTASTPRQPTWFDRLAHPGNFLRWSRPLLLPFALATALVFAIGLWFVFFNSPADYQMGDMVRVMYVHVPNAWLSQFVYAAMAVSALGTLVWRHPLADVANKAAAPLGAAFTALALYTGALWGRPTWGTYWEWDGRMTSTLVLLLIYLGIIALWRAFDDQLKAGRIVAIVTLVGAVNIPIIKFSVDWWNTLHQPASVFVAGGPRMPPSILTPLLLMSLAFTLLFLTLHIVRMRTEILRRRAVTMARQAALEEAR